MICAVPSRCACPCASAATSSAAKTLIVGVAEDSTFRLAERPVTVHVTDVAQDRVELQVTAWGADSASAKELASDVRERALTALGNEGLLPGSARWLTASAAASRGARRRSGGASSGGAGSSS